jgi:pilus assembly protein FimV
MPEPEPEPIPEPQPEPRPEPAYDEPSYPASSAADYYVQRGDTLWGIASRMRPDSSLTMNQTMVAIYETNPQAFDGNINRLKAGALLRVPSADGVFQISRGDAFAEVKRQNEDWQSGVTTPDTGYDDSDYTAYTDSTEPAETTTSLTLVPPDEEPAGVDYSEDFDTAEPPTREQEIEERIAVLESADVPDQQSLIEIRDNELANLRQELANIRGEVYEPVVEDVETMADEEASSVDDVADVDEAAAEAEAEPAIPSKVVRTARADEPSFMDRVMDALGSIWVKIIAGLALIAALVLWFVRRNSGDVTDESPWETPDREDSELGEMAATAAISAPKFEDDAIVVEEQDSGIRPADETVEVPVPDFSSSELDTASAEEDRFDSLEDTFSSATATNLEDADPLAEADFHMAYGLYDQAADLINGALEVDPGDKSLIAKLCEIYFVWGNRDAFVDAATRFKTALGDNETAEWDKVVIMGQQIAADNELFAGAEIAGGTQAVDVSFESDMDDSAELDMDFGGPDQRETDIIDLGAVNDDEVDFLFDADEMDETEETLAAVTVPEQDPEEEFETEAEEYAEDEDEDEDEYEYEEDTEIDLDDHSEADAADELGEEDDTSLDGTAQIPAIDEATLETPTVEQPFPGADDFSELPSLDEDLSEAITDSGQDAAATAEINLEELDLDIAGLEETELADLDDLDETGTNEILKDLEDLASETGSNPEVDPDEFDLDESPVADDTGIGEGLDLSDLEDDDSDEMRLAPDETGMMPSLDAVEETDANLDSDLLEATGHTQILDDDMESELETDLGESIGDEDVTMMAPVDDEDDFDFAKTEALPADAFEEGAVQDETGEMRALASEDLDLDLDDLTAALQVADANGDTVEQLRDDATVEQPRPDMVDDVEPDATMAIGPEEMSEGLHEARTMTEVGTKLDLARAYVDMGDPAGARSILEEVLDEGDEGQRQQAQQLLDSLPS